LREKVEEVEGKYLNQNLAFEVQQEELPGILEYIQNKINHSALTPEQRKSIIKCFGGLLDGSTSPLVKVEEAIVDRLKSLKVDTGSLPQHYANQMLSDFFTEEDLAKVKPEKGATLPKFYQLKDIDPIKSEADFERFVTIYQLRQRAFNLVEQLSKFARSIEKLTFTEKSLEKVKDLSKKVQVAEEKLQALVDKQRSKEQGANEKQLKVEEKARLKAEAELKKKQELEEKRLAEEAKKEEKRKAEEAKKEEKRLAEEAKKEEKRKAEEAKKEERRLAEEAKRLEREKLEKEKAEAAAKANNTVRSITQFFSITEKPKKEEAEAPSEEHPIWKIVLGKSSKTSEWSKDRQEAFEDNFTLLLNSQNPKLDSSSLSILDPFPIDVLKADLADQINHYKEKRYATVKCELPTTRKVFIKYEDYIFDSFEYRGAFKRRSTKIGPLTPFAKDEELIDYELSSDEEFQLEEADSINSKMDEEDEEESGEAEEDNFVVPDGYLSDEEVGSLEEDKSRFLLNLQKNIYKEKL